jgi:acetyl esterase/lipase
METRLDLTYSEQHIANRLIDIFLPDKANGDAIFFIHGGGWRGGSRQQWHPVAEHFCEMGFVCASASYRLIPEATYPDPVADVRHAMAWFRARADEYGFKPDRIASAGSSAGGHLVGMLATMGPDDDLGASDEMPLRDTRPNAAVLYCPAVRMYKKEGDSFTLSERRKEFFGDEVNEDILRKASPIDRVTGAEPPTLFIHGDADDTIPLDVSRDMCAKLEAAGVWARLEVLPGVGHGFGYGVTTDAQKDAIAHFERFLAEVFG